MSSSSSSSSSSDIATAVLASTPTFELPSTGSTLLRESIVDLPWRKSTFNIGYGLNAVTGHLTKTRALKEFRPASGNLKESTSIKILQSAESLKDQRGFSAGASLNMAPLDWSIDVLGSIKSACSVSATSVSMMVIYRSESEDDDTDVRYELTEDAAALARKDLVAFRAKYGDYFISGSRWGALFIAVATYTCTDVEKRDAVVGVLGSTASSVFNAHVAARVDKDLSSLQAEVSITICTIGLAPDAYSASDAPSRDRTPHSLVDIVAQLEWFQYHKSTTGDRICALLRHYSVAQDMEDIIPPILAIPRTVFDGVEMLRDTVFNCQLLARGLPDYTSDDPIVPALQQRVHSLEQHVYDAQFHIVTDEACRTALLASAKDLEAQLTAFRDTYLVFLRLLHHCKKQPGGYRNDRGDSYSYGLNPEHSRSNCNIVVGETTEIIVRSRLYEPDFAIATVKRPPGGHIVGWRVQAMRPKHSTWRQHSASVILAPEGEISCKRKPVWQNWFHQCKWQFTVFVVQNNPYMDLFYSQIDFENKGSMTTLQTEPTAARGLPM